MAASSLMLDPDVTEAEPPCPRVLMVTLLDLMVSVLCGDSI